MHQESLNKEYRITALFFGFCFITYALTTVQLLFESLFTSLEVLSIGLSSWNFIALCFFPEFTMRAVGITTPSAINEVLDAFIEDTEQDVIYLSGEIAQVEKRATTEQEDSEDFYQQAS